MKSFFVFDVESIGLHGEGFAVAGGVYLENGAAQCEFGFSVLPDSCLGTHEDLDWVHENVPILTTTHGSAKRMRDAFWLEWIKAKSEGARMAVECGWPVEARFLAQCVDDDYTRKFEGPYPMVEISSIMLAAGMDPMEKYPRTESEKPEHSPLADARQSARLLSEALKRINAWKQNNSKAVIPA